jgi:predicted ferric reductase
MLVISVFRNSSYEIFLIIHIILAVFTLAGTWYHLDYRFQDDWGYKNWLYICFAVWAFDRVVRVGRMLKNGMRKASFRPVGDEILRVDIEGVKWEAKPGQHAYIFFPVLRKFTPWENHPFSVIPSNYLRPIRA